MPQVQQDNVGFFDMADLTLVHEDFPPSLYRFSLLLVHQITGCKYVRNGRERSWFTMQVSWFTMQVLLAYFYVPCLCGNVNKLLLLCCVSSSSRPCIFAMQSCFANLFEQNYTSFLPCLLLTAPGTPPGNCKPKARHARGAIEGGVSETAAVTAAAHSGKSAGKRPAGRRRQGKPGGCLHNRFHEIFFLPFLHFPFIVSSDLLRIVAVF